MSPDLYVTYNGDHWRVTCSCGWGADFVFGPVAVRFMDAHAALCALSKLDNGRAAGRSTMERAS